MHDFVQAVLAAIALVGDLDPEVVGIVGLSLRVSLSASVIAMVIGAPLAGVLAISRFWGDKRSLCLSTRCLGCRQSWLGSRSTSC